MMVYVNKNSALETLQGLVEQSFNKTQSYMPEGFSEKQQEALNLFKQRIFLEEVIEESVGFNKNLDWTYDSKNLKLIGSAEELIEVYKLRSDVYTQIGYQEECPDIIEGLNFDKFDKNSAILYFQNNGIVTGTCRLIFDSKNKLPTEEKVSFNTYREKHNSICELSRLIISHNSDGLGLEFKNLALGIYKIYESNDIEIILSGIRKDHFKLYKKFGGFKVECELERYGKVNIPFVVTSWNPAEISPFFKRAFLNIR